MAGKVFDALIVTTPVLLVVPVTPTIGQLAVGLMFVDQVPLIAMEATGVVTLLLSTKVMVNLQVAWSENSGQKSRTVPGNAGQGLQQQNSSCTQGALQGQILPMAALLSPNKSACMLVCKLDTYFFYVRQHAGKSGVRCRGVIRSHVKY